MPRWVLIGGAALGAALVAFWVFGGMTAVETRAIGAQREVQNAMAGALRRLRSGDGAALATLLGIAFSYGVVHAAGPGHGKFLLGGYGLARHVRLLPLAGIALASSVMQATTAVVLVYGGVTLLGWGRAQLEAVSARWLDPAGYLLIALVGGWLALRGGRALWRARRRGAPVPAHAPLGRSDHPMDDPYGHAPHVHADGAVCASCGHAHGPTPEQVAGVTSLREAAALIASIGIRPCTGALFLLILTWQMGIGAAGIAGAYAMGIGTATVTVAVAVLAVWAREGVFALPGIARFRAALPVAELVAGLAVMAAALHLMSRAL